MNRPLIAVLLSWVAIVPPLAAAGSLPADLDVKILEVPLFSQKQGVWCWATATQMILAYHGEEISQCQQASNLATWQARGMDPSAARTDCCNVDLSLRPKTEVIKACVQADWPRFGNFGFEAESTSEQCKRKYLKETGGPESGFWEDCALSWAAVKREIDAHRPFAFTWAYPWGGHMMVGAGYVETPSGEKWVLINDPYPPDNADASLVTYEYYVGGPFGGHPKLGHWKDYRSIRPEGTPAPPTSEDDLVTYASVKAELDAAERRSDPVAEDPRKVLTGWFANWDPRVKEWEAALQPAMRVIRAFVRAPETPPFLLPLPESDHLESEYLELWSPGPLEVVTVTADQLVSLQNGTGPDLEVREVILPINWSDFRPKGSALDDLRTAVTLRKYASGWKVVSIGRSTLIESVDNILKNLLKDERHGLSTTFWLSPDGTARQKGLRLVHQGCCYQMYLEDRDSGKWYALYDHVRLGFERGEEVDRKTLFEYLKECSTDCPPALPIR